MVLDSSEQIEKIKEFIETYYQTKLHDVIQKGAKSLILDFKELSLFDLDLAESLITDPEDVIKSAELAVEQLDIPEKADLRVRFKNLPESQLLKIKDIRSIHLDKFFYIEGIVRQASEVRPQVTSAKFECPSCGNTITILQLETQFREPSRCSCGRKGKFRLLSKVLVDAQALKVEEIPEALEGGEQAKRLAVFLKEDLVEPLMEKKTTPGSKVRIYGVIKEVPIILRTGAHSIRYDLMMDANNIEPLEETFSDTEISKEDEELIQSLAKDPEIYSKLTNSIAPSIYGHDKIKEALVLQMMGGVRKKNEDGTIRRGDFHILLVGDPGAGKSAMLIFVSKAAPKARYVSGKGVSGAGLTAAVVKDEFLKGFALEAGALVLANGGYCVIDELDKMNPEDRSAMHEALEQQTVSIHKANIQATLRAETTVLAAANPKLGRFDPYTPIAAQIDLPASLINRFDLIFPIRDIPNKEKDDKIASHILALQKDTTSMKPIIPVEVLKKYVSYAKQRIQPKLTEGAIEEIKSFYVQLRNQGSTSEDDIKPIPISARQLEALVRLSEGAARVRLSNKVTRKDAKVAIELLKYSLMQVGFDYETGMIDIDRISTGITASQRNKIVTIKDIINNLEQKVGKSIPLDDIIAEAAEKGIDEAQVEEIVDKLKRDGEIFEPKRGSIQKI